MAQRRVGHQMFALATGGLATGVGAIAAAHSKEGPPTGQAANLLRALPLNAIGLTAGYISAIPIPRPLRASVFSYYCSLVGCDPLESDRPLDEFSSLAAFFARSLRSDARSVDSSGTLVSPADGVIMALGPVGAFGTIEVKGSKYRIRDLLAASEREPLSVSSVAVADRSRQFESESMRLWYAVLHMSPGHCHRFSSPARWMCAARRHVAGYLLWLNPQIEGLYTQNERVVLVGTWSHGLFTMTAVGAAGRGTIALDFEKDICRPGIRTACGHIDHHGYKSPVALAAGDSIGGFLLGSAIVLVFEAPENEFEFTAQAGDSIRTGEKLGDVKAPSTDKPATISGPLNDELASSTNAPQSGRSRFQRAW